MNTCRTRSRRSGAVMLIVLVAMMFAAFALTVFIQKSTSDLLIEARVQTAARLRSDAYSALESSLAVLGAFRKAQGELHSPAEGWAEPLELAGFEAEDGRDVSVRFVDESGRISLVHVEFTQLKKIFENWGMRPGDGERCADALLAWTREGYVPQVSIGLEDEEYDRGEMPYKAPHKPLRSWQELRAIAGVRKIFFDESGAPTEYFARITQAFSLLDYPAPNANSAVPEAFLGTDGQQPDWQARRLRDFREGRDSSSASLNGYFKNDTDVTRVLGALPAGVKLETVIRALRVIVTVREGNNAYTLDALVAPEGGAQWPTGDAKSDKPPADPAAQPPADQKPAANTQPKASNLPFAVLEILENDLPVTLRGQTADEPTP